MFSATLTAINGYRVSSPATYPVPVQFIAFVSIFGHGVTFLSTSTILHLSNRTIYRFPFSILTGGLNVHFTSSNSAVPIVPSLVASKLGSELPSPGLGNRDHIRTKSIKFFIPYPFVINQTITTFIAATVSSDNRINPHMIRTTFMPSPSICQRPTLQGSRSLRLFNLHNIVKVC